jgi:hypothetical protein
MEQGKRVEQRIDHRCVTAFSSRDTITRFFVLSARPPEARGSSFELRTLPCLFRNCDTQGLSRVHRPLESRRARAGRHRINFSSLILRVAINANGLVVRLASLCPSFPPLPFVCSF